MTDAEYNAVFKLPFKEAESFFKEKLNIPTERWDDLWRDEHAKGFMSAGAQKAELLSGLRNAVEKSIAGGMTKKEFAAEFDNLAATHGWSYKGGRNWRSALIYDTNITTAYQAGRWQQFQEGGTQYLKYVHADGVMNPRPQHVAWNGTVLPIDHEFWRTHYPPNGWRCHCRAVRAEAPQVTPEPAGWRGIDPKTETMTGIDKGWDYNVGQAGAAPGYRALTQKFETLPPEIAKEWMKEFVKEPAFAQFIDGKIKGDFPVAVLDKKEMEVLDTKAQTVWFSSDSLAKNKGEIPTRSAGHPELTLDDYRLIPEIIDSGEIYTRNDEKLIYLFRGDRVYRAVLKKTKDGSENYFLSLFLGSADTKTVRQALTKYERIR